MVENNMLGLGAKCLGLNISNQNQIQSISEGPSTIEKYTTWAPSPVIHEAITSISPLNGRK